MKQFTAIILAVALLLSLSACAGREDMSTATTASTTTTIETESTTATIESVLEDAIESVLTNAPEATPEPTTEVLHPLYRQVGYPNYNAEMWIAADEVEPTLDANCPYGEWLKCVYTGEFTTEGGEETVNVYLYIWDGLIGTWIVSNQGYALNAYGFRYERTVDEYNIHLRSADPVKKSKNFSQ